MLALLRREAEALADLHLRFSRLRDARERPRAQLEALAAAIDERTDACIRIQELVAEREPSERRSTAVTALGRLFRRQGVLRARVLSLYIPRTDGNSEP